jgi:hypothetical protein
MNDDPSLVSTKALLETLSNDIAEARSRHYQAVNFMLEAEAILWELRRRLEPSLEALGDKP